MASSHDFFMTCFNKTKHFSKFWKELGVNLRLKMDCLDVIESDNRGDVTLCRMKMLDSWLKTNPADPEAELKCCLRLASA